ncbi:MAG: hypothetical protein LBT43_21025 [Prevotella sp.]|jgi:hypothetical protein|nr:hypothetical protein [Prevotella sp.]MDR2001416.1 hypothetical protein [Prevotella sp.]
MNISKFNIKISLKYLLLFLVFNIIACNGNAMVYENIARKKYNEMQRSIAVGWNTWDTRSVLRHVLLPYGVAIDINLAVDGKRINQFFIGDREEGSARMKPGSHSYDGYYTDITASWNGLVLRVESAADSLSNVIIITPQEGSAKGGKVIVSIKELWQRANYVSTSGNKFSIKTVADSLNLEGEVLGELLENKDGEIILSADKPIVINCGRQLDYEQARFCMDGHYNTFVSTNKEKYGTCYNEYNAMQNVLGWDNIFDPTINRVITPVSRIWNVGWSNNSDLGGFVLFCWDTYFASMMLSVDNKELAYANAVEITKGLTEQGFIPNFYTESNYKSRDRSQPPVGTLAVWSIYKKYKDKWFLELLYNDFLKWNRWWDENRQTDGLLCWGSTPFEPVTYRYWELVGVNETFGGALESGQDNSHMYDSIPFDKERHQQMLNDVGLNSLYIMDCNLLAKIADELGQKEDADELRHRGRKYSENLSRLWDEKASFYYNLRTDMKVFSRKTSPTNFYPLLTKSLPDKQAEDMIRKHLLNPDEFWGEWVIPATPRNDPAFKENTYWKGRIWAPLNFLVYMGLRNYDTPMINDVRRQFSEKSGNLLLKSWLSDGYVFENYNATTGKGDDVTNSDKFYHWGALLGFICLIEQGYYY